MKTKLLALWILLLPIMMVMSCKKDNAALSSGQLNVRMMDAPSPYNFDQVNVDIQSVEVNVTDMNGQSQWITLRSNVGVYNLLNFVNGVDTLLASGQVVNGRIEQMRFILGENNSVVIAGISYPMNVPSGNTSGLKLNIHESINPSVPLNVFIDFDVAQSVFVNGNGSYSLKPVIRAFTENETGSINGRITTATPGVAIVIGDPQTVETTYANAITGEFMLRGVPSGTYTLKVYPANSDVPVVLDGIIVNAGTGTDVGLIHIPR